MPAPRNYVRGYSFAGYQATNPNRPLPGPALDNELEEIEQSLTEAISGLNDIRRADGQLKNGIVGVDALAPDIITGVRPATLWQTGIQYQKQDTVSYLASFYRCTIDHLSTNFLTDLTATRWELYAELGSIATDAQIARNEAVAAAAAAVPAGAAATAGSNNVTALYDLFDDRYLGEKTALPTLDNDGNALVNGALVSLTGQTPTTLNGMYVRRGGAWHYVVAPFLGAFSAYRYVATAAQTVITGADANGGTLAYTPGAIMVTVNGVTLAPNTYTATNGTSVVLGTALSASDAVVVYSFGSFSVADAESANFTPAGSGAVVRTIQTKIRETVSVKDFGAFGDGVTNDSLAFTRAFAASSTVIVPPGVYIANVIIPNGGHLLGTHRDLSVIRAVPGANSTAVAGFEAYALFGTATYNTSRGANRVVIRDLTIDGNRANVTTSGDGIAIWGWGTTLERIRVVNCRSSGIHTEWTDGNASMEGHFRDIVIDTAGGHGWFFAGPHDSNVDDIIIMDASKNANDTSYGLYVGPNGSGGGANGRFRNVHVWCRGGETNRPAYAAYSNGGNEFTDCHFEGCRRGISLGDRDVVTSGRIYANFGANGSANVYFRTNFSIVNGVQFDTVETAPNPNGSMAQNSDVYAIDFGTSSANLVTNCMFVGFKLRTPFNFAASGGNRIVNCVGYANPGGATTFGGTISANDFIDYVQSGTAIRYINRTEAIPYAANDAAAAALGVPLFGQYLNSGNSAITVRQT
jgi:hypothetical protein